jgi:hypothetical protein
VGLFSRSFKASKARQRRLKRQNPHEIRISLLTLLKSPKFRTRHAASKVSKPIESRWSSTTMCWHTKIRNSSAPISARSS